MQGNTSPSVTTSVLYTMRRRTSGSHKQINAIWKQQLGSKVSIWHRRFGHLRVRSLRLVSGFDYNLSNDIDFCESCVIGKLHRTSRIFSHLH